MRITRSSRLFAAFVAIFCVGNLLVVYIVNLYKGGTVVTSRNTGAVSGYVPSLQIRQENLVPNIAISECPKPVPRVTISCKKWAVVTTIFNASKAVKQVAGLPGWCLVVVLDKKTPVGFINTFPAFGNVTVLDVAWQQNNCKYLICKLLPWNHFGRKNIGYLYAIQHGAEFIYDFDDDNQLQQVNDKWFPFTQNRMAEISYADTDALNPYGDFEQGNDIWPRGFPLENIRKHVTEMLESRPRIHMKDIAIVQSLADIDPDVDAIYRLTRKLPRSFRSTPNQRLVAVGAGAMAPYNAQATLHSYSAFWGLLLPTTVHGRVSDIWRSYFTQRILWDLGMNIAFSSPWVNHFRSNHSYLGDFAAEMDLYFKSKHLITYLRRETFEGDSVLAKMISLYKGVYSYGFIKSSDLHLLSAWLTDLKCVGYRFPDLLATKNFVYLNQGRRRKMYPQFITDGSSDFIMLTFDAQDGDIYLPNSSHSQGRNALLMYAASRAAFTPGGGYKYYIMTDDDANVTTVDNRPDFFWRNDMPSNPWRRLEAFLIDFEPAMCAPQYTHLRPFQRMIIKHPSGPANATLSVDQCVVAYHRDTLSFLMPFQPYSSGVSWYYPCLYVRIHVALIYHHYRYQVNSLLTINTEGHDGNSRYKDVLDWTEVWTTFESFLSKSNEANSQGLLETLKKMHPSRGGIERYISDGTPLKKGSFNYKVTDEHIRQYWNMSSPFIQTRLIWRRYYPIAKILNFNSNESFEADSIYLK